jgi:hypothetical protein
LVGVSKGCSRLGLGRCRIKVIGTWFVKFSYVSHPLLYRIEDICRLLRGALSSISTN